MSISNGGLHFDPLGLEKVFACSLKTLGMCQIGGVLEKCWNSCWKPFKPTTSRYPDKQHTRFDWSLGGSGKPTQARHPVSTPERAAPVATERAVPAPRRKEEPKAGSSASERVTQRAAGSHWCPFWRVWLNMERSHWLL